MKHILSIFLILSVTASKGQVQLISATELCTMMSGFSSDEEAHSVLNELLEVVHWEKNFVMAPCSGVDNACAVNINGVRYILYNPSFMESMDNKAGDVAGYFILAHEMAHHILLHSKDLLLFDPSQANKMELAEKRKQELEADEYAAMVLAALGYSLGEIKLALKSFDSDWRSADADDDTYSTHPSIYKRLAAVNKGYFQVIDRQEGHDAMSLYMKGGEAFNQQDYYSAIRYFEASLEIIELPLNWEGLGQSHLQLEHYEKALACFSIALEFDLDYDILYDKGVSLWYLNRKSEACDCWKTCYINDNEYTNYVDFCN